MRRIVFLVVLLVIIATFGGVSYRFLTIRKGSHVYFMKKSTGTFDRVYVDVSQWSFVDYGAHPRISAFLASKGIHKNKDEWKKKLQNKINSAKEEIKSFKEKVSTD